MEIKVGMTGRVDSYVEREDTAAEVGSGSLLVYATPCMVALMEGAACEAIAAEIPEGKTSVGIELNIRHIRHHDAALENPSFELIDVSRIFPLFHLDENDPKNYRFAQTDDYFSVVADMDVEIDFRLGEMSSWCTCWQQHSMRSHDRLIENIVGLPAVPKE